MKHVEVSELETRLKKPKSFYRRTFEDIESHDRALSDEIEHLRSARQQLLQLKTQLPDAPSLPCIFCGGESRDLSMVIKNSGAFGNLGNGALALDFQRDYGPVPTQWECQECGAFDSDLLVNVSRVWSRDQPPGRKTLSRQMLDAFPDAEGVALAETSYDTVWMLQVSGTWYVLPGTGAQIIDRLRLKYP